MSRAHAIATFALALFIEPGCVVADSTDGSVDEIDEPADEAVNAARLTSDDGGCPSVIPKRNAPCSDLYIGCAYLGPKGRTIGMYCDGAKWVYDKRVR